MSYQEKKTITSILTGALVLAAYCIYAFGKFQAGGAATGDMKFWAVTILVYIGIGIAAAIVIQIVFHILHAISIAVREMPGDDKKIDKAIKADMVEDERDKLIELKSMKVGFYVSGAGFIAGLVALVLNFSPTVMINILFIAFSIGAICEGFAQLYFYRRGV